MVEEALPLVLTWLRSVELGPETGRVVMRRLAVYVNRGLVEHAEG
jgi:hypothetical protein